MSKYIKELFTILGTKQNPSTAYHPQTDGQTECMNQNIEQYLRVFISYRQDDWKEWLATAEFPDNNSVHASTQQTPFFLNYGQHPWTGEDTRREVRNQLAAIFAEWMQKIRIDAKAALEQAAERMKWSYDKHARPTIEYAIRDKVYHKSTNIKSHQPSRQLSDKHYGPFEILKKIGESAYKLKLHETWLAIHPVFNESYLSPYQLAKYRKQQKPPPPPIDIEGEPEYTVEEICDSKKYQGKIKYLVHWEGYPTEEDTWEPIENVKNAQKLIEQFHQ
jgi:hypothetical protein